MGTVNKFLNIIMKNDYLKCENDHFIKYTNNNYDIIQQKTKKGHKESCVIIDKIGNKNGIKYHPIVYTNINIAFRNIKFQSKL